MHIVAMLWTEYYHRLLVILTLLTQVCMDRLLHYSHIALSLFARLYRTLSSNSHICFCEIKCFGTRYTTCNILTSIDKNFSILSYIFFFSLAFLYAGLYRIRRLFVSRAQYYFSFSGFNKLHT